MTDITDNTDKLYYSISEVAEKFNVNTSLIRFWEKEFPNYIKPRKKRNGRRMFTSKDIEIIRQIYLLTKEKGFTLSGAKNSLNVQKKGIDKESQLLETLSKIRTFLIDIKSELNKTNETANR